MLPQVALSSPRSDGSETQRGLGSATARIQACVAGRRGGGKSSLYQLSAVPRASLQYHRTLLPLISDCYTFVTPGSTIRSCLSSPLAT